MSNSTDVLLAEAIPHLQPLFHFALRLSKNIDVAKDLVQETMLKACKHIHTYEQGSNCRAWLFQICKNSYINLYHRRRMHALPLYDNIEGQEYARLPEMVTERSYETNLDSSLNDAVSNALHRLPLCYQTVLILADIEGQTYEEISDFTGVPMGTVRSRLHRGRKILAGMLEGYARNAGYMPPLVN